MKLIKPGTIFSAKIIKHYITFDTDIVYIMNPTQEQLKLKLTQALVAAFGTDYTNTDPILVSASNPKFGDYQANVALSLSKKLGKPPRIIAGEIVNKLDVSDICEPPEIAGPGFINLKLQTSYLEAQLNAFQLDSRL